MRRVFTLALWMLTGVAVTAGCGRKQRSKPRPRPDASVRPGQSDTPPPGPRRPWALQALLAEVPARATWYVGLGRPAALFAGGARYWRMLAQIPGLGASMTHVATRLTRALGAWPPPSSLWSKVGIDPGGAIVLARVPGTAGAPAGFLVLAFTSTPDKLLRHLVGPAGVPARATARALLEGGDAWWCGRVSPGVACATSRSLVAERVTPGPQAAAPTLGAQLSRRTGRAGRDLDLAAGWRSEGAKALSTATARFRPWGLQVELHPHGGWLGRWLSWLAPPAAVPAPPVGAVATAWMRLSPTRVQTLVGLLPRGAIQSKATGDAAPVTLLGQCTGEARLAAGAAGWSLRAQRRGRAVGKAAAAWEVSGWPLWARAPDQRLVLAETAAGTRPPRASSPVVVPEPLRRLGARRASAAARLPLMDPLEPLAAADRVRAVAAMVGLPAGERALVGLVRGLLTLLGVAGVSVAWAPRGAVMRLVFVSPAAPSAPGRRAFERLWRAKWQGGGFFDRRALARLARGHPRWALGHLARGILELRLSTVSSRLVTDRLLKLAAELSGPELSCASLVARLEHCAEPFARRRAPRRWQEMQSVVLPDHRLRLRRTLLDAARRETEALGAHCDRLGGRLENAAAVKACLAPSGCATFVRCLMRAFAPR